MGVGCVCVRGGEQIYLCVSVFPGLWCIRWHNKINLVGRGVCLGEPVSTGCIGGVAHF